MKKPNTPSHAPARRYLIRTGLFMGGYVAVNFAAMAGAFDDAGTAAAWTLGLVASAPVVGQIWVLLVFMRDSDEFIRGITARRFIIAAGLTIALFSGWGFLEFYAEAWRAPAFLIFPLLWLAFAAVTPFVRSTR